MEKTATLNLRVNPIAKQRAEQVLKQLGIPMSILPRVAPSSEVYGAVAQGIPGSVHGPDVKKYHH